MTSGTAIPSAPAPEAGTAPLADILALALQAGMLAHQSGASTHRTSLLMRDTAAAHGVALVDVMISSTNIGLTIMRDGESHTSMRKVPHMAVDFSVLCALSRWQAGTRSQPADLQGASAALARIAQTRTVYPPLLVIGMVGVACGSFAALFGGDLMAVIIAAVGATLGGAVKAWLLRRHFSHAIFATVASFVAILATGLLCPLSTTPNAALAASGLFLIPGVPLINAASDLLNANYLNGVVRLTLSAVVVFGLALGMSLALRLLPV
ncbi:Inner membrane protein YjjP [Andreprevotia sp. IGB-42]|uniref:threonine/serine exporter family protein n=1 Tax=Andreprevotia sp. IGB-42 TaxID=2497473 RepID=UPI00135B1C16|nr:threonine/serine exporter family protein [Andreprevotia sp. IGB-42]KAF0813897.1 Inner membrane protein YjjP [Andreprevotia sp. IGB-42]